MNLDDLLPPELAMDDEPFSPDDFEQYLIFGPSDPEAVTNPDAYTDHAQVRSTIHAWRIEADDQADWALRKLALAEAETQLRKEQADEWIARIVAWREEVSAAPARTASFMRERVEDYAMRVREAGGPATIKLPAGEVKTSVRAPFVRIDGEEDVAHWIAGLMADPDSWFWPLAEEIGDPIVKLTPKVYVGPLRKLVTVGKVSEGIWARSTLACGHHVDQQAADLYDPDVPERGDMLACFACQVGPNDAPMEAVEVTIVQERFRATVVGPDGAEVPGAAVDPGGVNVTVKAR